LQFRRVAAHAQSTTFVRILWSLAQARRPFHEGMASYVGRMSCELLLFKMWPLEHLLQSVMRRPRTTDCEYKLQHYSHYLDLQRLVYIIVRSAFNTFTPSSNWHIFWQCSSFSGFNVEESRFCLMKWGLMDLSKTGESRHQDEDYHGYFPDRICPCFLGTHFNEMHDGNPFREMDIGEWDVRRLHQTVMPALLRQRHLDSGLFNFFCQCPSSFLISKRGAVE